MDYGLIEWCNGLRTYDIYIYTAFTQYPNRYLYPTFSESDSYRIRYSLFVSVTESIRIRICIRTLSVSESESEQKYENKYNMSDIRSYPIRFHPYWPPPKGHSPQVKLEHCCVEIKGLFACLNSGGIWMVWRNVGGICERKTLFRIKK